MMRILFRWRRDSDGEWLRRLPIGDKESARQFSHVANGAMNICTTKQLFLNGFWIRLLFFSKGRFTKVYFLRGVNLQISLEFAW